MKDIDTYRPGNFVVLENSSDHPRIVKVTQIEYTDNVITSLQINGSTWISKKEIKPVSLFIDCLFDLKFYISSTIRRNEAGDLIKVDCQEDIYHYYNGSLELKVHKYDNTIWYENRQIHYIHQLQNLCSDVTGESFILSDLYENHFNKTFFEFQS
ncbi:hypothetical protein [Bacteroides sedimenti]|uniref:Uncharacterized protein n=1 Tax=Bacteroides sedimenti TaxID=2136147 RepID=A0ABM8ICL6_9BACE